jgi:hypothetical protein
MDIDIEDGYRWWYIQQESPEMPQSISGLELRGLFCGGNGR